MNSSDSNTSLSTDQSKPSQQNVLERVAGRSAKKAFFQKTWLQFMFKTRSSEYKAQSTNKNIGSFEAKIHIHPMLETPIIPLKISQN